MRFRHELKQEITYADMIILRQRLKSVMQMDVHASDGKYTIRSIYFENGNDKVLREKLDGINVRDKYRIRYYNDDSSLIHLEKKSKINGLCLKNSVRISKEETEAILSGDNSKMANHKEPLVRELYLHMKQEGLRPKTIVDYTREPFVFGPGNVRVTMDSNIRTGMHSIDFFNASCVTVPIENNPIILEVKWDDFLPDIIKDLIQLNGGQAESFSKYAACRMYD